MDVNVLVLGVGGVVVEVFLLPWKLDALIWPGSVPSPLTLIPVCCKTETNLKEVVGVALESCDEGGCACDLRAGV